MWAPDYVDPDGLKNYQRIDDTIDDDEIAGACTAASRAIDNATGRQFGQLDAAETWTYGPEVARVWRPDLQLYVIDIDDVQDTTGLTVDGVAYAGSGAVLLPRNAPRKGRPYTQLGFTSCPSGDVDVHARFGWSAFPAGVVMAAKLQGNRFANRRDSPYGVAGSPQQGTELRLLARLDPDVAVNLKGLSRRPKVG